MIAEDLVDDDLKEQRRDKGEDLEKERGCENLNKQMAVLMDGTQEPADAEAAREVHQSRATCHQHQAAVPDCLELCA